MTGRPSELAITLATLPGRYGSEDGWQAADQVRHRLGLLGFDATAQQVAAWLGRMARADAPWVERRTVDGHYGEYRVTQWGSNDLDNRLRLSVDTPWTRSTS